MGEFKDTTCSSSKEANKTELFKKIKKERNIENIIEYDCSKTTRTQTTRMHFWKARQMLELGRVKKKKNIFISIKKK